jgi:pSer/pThr/pTyr-binding forkhead associated (FHA) protein
MSRVTVSTQPIAKIYYWSHFDCEVCGCKLPL